MQSPEKFLPADPRSVCNYKNKGKDSEGKGFEPSVQLPVRRFSKPVPLAARPPLQKKSYDKMH